MDSPAEQEAPDDGAAGPTLSPRIIAQQQLAGWVANQIDRAFYESILQGKQLSAVSIENRIRGSAMASPYAAVDPKCPVCEGIKENDENVIKISVRGNSPKYSFAVCKVCYLTYRVSGATTALELHEHRMKQNASV